MISRHETVSSVLLPLAVILSTSKSSQNIHGSTRIYKYARYSIRNMLDSKPKNAPMIFFYKMLSHFSLFNVPLESVSVKNTRISYSTQLHTG